MSSEINIVTPDLSQPGYAGRPLNPTRVGFEVRAFDPNPPEVKKRGILSRIFGAFGRVLGAFAPVGFLFGPPGILAGAAAAGVGALAAKKDQEWYANNAQQTQYRPLPVGYPGLSIGSGLQDSTLDLVSYSREAAVSEAIHRGR